MVKLFDDVVLMFEDAVDGRVGYTRTVDGLGRDMIIVEDRSSGERDIAVSLTVDDDNGSLFVITVSYGRLDYVQTYSNPVLGDVVERFVELVSDRDCAIAFLDSMIRLEMKLFFSSVLASGSLLSIDGKPVRFLEDAPIDGEGRHEFSVVVDNNYAAGKLGGRDWLDNLANPHDASFDSVVEAYMSIPASNKQLIIDGVLDGVETTTITGMSIVCTR